MSNKMPHFIRMPSCLSCTVSQLFFLMWEICSLHYEYAFFVIYALVWLFDPWLFPQVDCELSVIKDITESLHVIWYLSHDFVVVQLLYKVSLLATSWAAASRLLCFPLSPRVCSDLCPLSWRSYLTISSSAPPLLLLTSVFPSLRIFSNASSLVAQPVKILPAMWETWVQSLAWEDPLEKGTATHSSTLENTGEIHALLLHLYLNFHFISGGQSFGASALA